MADLIPEPPDRARVEWKHHGDVYAARRDDKDAADAGWPRGQSWCLYGQTVPRTWVWLCDRFGWSLRHAVRLYRQAELDAAVKAAQVTPVGPCLKEPGGWCRTHGVQHSEVEWARIHDQATEEESRG